jgi:hypothetical protein
MGEHWKTEIDRLIRGVAQTLGDQASPETQRQVTKMLKSLGCAIPVLKKQEFDELFRRRPAEVWSTGAFEKWIKEVWEPWVDLPVPEKVSVPSPTTEQKEPEEMIDEPVSDAAPPMEPESEPQSLPPRTWQEESAAIVARLSTGSPQSQEPREPHVTPEAHNLFPEPPMKKTKSPLDTNIQVPGQYIPTGKPDWQAYGTPAGYRLSASVTHSHSLKRLLQSARVSLR